MSLINCTCFITVHFDVKFLFTCRPGISHVGVGGVAEFLGRYGLSRDIHTSTVQCHRLTGKDLDKLWPGLLKTMAEIKIFFWVTNRPEINKSYCT